ncbi:MAG: SPOR domain-containing protein [Novosphingobium sp.]
MRLPVDRIAALTALSLLAACGGSGERLAVAAPAASGPAADYPMTLGEPFAIDGTTWKPADTLNYDAVGYAALDPAGGEAITVAHKTLPLPSYVEVTSLATGRTILARVERRGPMTNSRLVALSPGAVAQLALTGDAAVRVRRVNPPEPERAALRGGSRATERMETPKSLLVVLTRKLDMQNGVAAPAVTPPAPALAAAVRPAAKPAIKPPAAPTGGGNVVQVAAFSARARADAAAGKLGGTVSPAGRLWRVRLGPFSSPADASAALAKAKGAGYSDARILRAD